MESTQRTSWIDLRTVVLAAVAIYLIVMSFVLPSTERQNAFVTFSAGRRSAFILFVLFAALVLYGIDRARRGAPLYVRPITGLKAINEAIGRATEMGRKVLFVPGIQDMTEIQTIAAMGVLGHISRQTAAYGAELDVPNMDP